MAHPAYRYPPGLRQQVFNRDNWECQIRLAGCTRQARELDHIIPKSRGGMYHDPANLRAACKNCNLKRNQTLRDTGTTPTIPPATRLLPEHW